MRLLPSSKLIGESTTIEAGGVHHWLERRARLSHGLYGAIELATRIVVAADHRAHAPGVGIEREEGSFGVGILIERRFEHSRLLLLDLHENHVAGAEAS